MSSPEAFLTKGWHVPTDYKRLCEWLIIDCEGAGDLAESAHVFS